MRPPGNVGYKRAFVVLESTYMVLPTLFNDVRAMHRLM